MVGGAPVFGYRPGRSILHRLPAAAKIIGLCGLGLAAFRLDLAAGAAAAGALALIGVLCGVRARELVHDLTPGLFYAAFLWAADCVAHACGADVPCWPPRPATLLLAVRLLVALELSSLLFRTTSTLELREGVGGIERACRRCVPGADPRPRLALALALFLGFIPRIFETRARLVLAWRARGGRPGLRRLAKLFPALISLSLDRAAVTDLALRARSADGGRRG